MWSSSRAWVAGVLVASFSLSLARVPCPSHSLYKEEGMESARNSTPMSDTSLVVYTKYRVCSLP